MHRGNAAGMRGWVSYDTTIGFPTATASGWDRRRDPLWDPAPERRWYGRGTVLLDGSHPEQVRRIETPQRGPEVSCSPGSPVEGSGWRLAPQLTPALGFPGPPPFAPARSPRCGGPFLGTLRSIVEWRAPPEHPGPAPRTDDASTQTLQSRSPAAQSGRSCRPSALDGHR